MAYAHLIKPGDKVSLEDINPGQHDGLEKECGLVELAKLGIRMAELQELMFAAGQDALLVVLQGMDTSGKDGAIRTILNYVNVQSCRVASFKQPTEQELAHDFLWRVHAQTPAKGGMTVFNRSHYEDVLIVRVHELAPKGTISDRYARINAFEEILSASGTMILKFFLNISKDEQRERLLDREKDPTKSWKLSVNDWKERELWSDYQRAYDDAITKCSTHHSPWRVVNANHKWFRDLSIAEAIVEELEPKVDSWKDHLKLIGKERVAELEAFRAKK